MMVYEIIEIYRVVCDEHYNQMQPETHWCLDKKTMRGLHCCKQLQALPSHREINTIKQSNKTMTREEKLQQFAEQYTKGLYLDRHNLIQMVKAGAEWADQHPQWIPVEDELPPKTTDWANPKYFLGSTEEGGIHKMYRMGDPTICKDFENEQLYLHVTHWMPLPEAPRKEE